MSYQQHVNFRNSVLFPFDVHVRGLQLCLSHVMQVFNATPFMGPSPMLNQFLKILGLKYSMLKQDIHTVQVENLVCLGNIIAQDPVSSHNLSELIDSVISLTLPSCCQTPQQWRPLAAPLTGKVDR